MNNQSGGLPSLVSVIEKKGDNTSNKNVSNCDTNNTHCIAEQTANELIDLKKRLEDPLKMARDYVTEKVKVVAETVKNAVVNPLECGKIVAGSFTDIIPNTIDKASLALDKLYLSLDKLNGSMDHFFNGLGGREIPGYPNLFGPFEVLYAKLILDMQGMLNKILLGENADKILSDPKFDPKNLLAELMKNSKKYLDVSKSKEFQGIFKEWLVNYVESVMNALNIAKEPIDKVKNEVIKIIDGLGKDLGNSVQAALSNVITLGLGAIPGVGTVIDIAYAGERIGKKILNACETGVSTGAGIVLPTANKINKGVDYTKCRVNELKDKLAPLMNTSQAGGMSVERKRKNINKATKRVKRMLLRFTRRQSKPINYAKRLSKLRM